MTSVKTDVTNGRKRAIYSEDAVHGLYSVQLFVDGELTTMLGFNRHPNMTDNQFKIAKNKLIRLFKKHVGVTPEEAASKIKLLKK